MSDIVPLKSFPSRLEAELAKGRLEAAGITSFIEADDAGGAYPFPLSGHMKGIRLSVRTSDADTARELLRKGS